MVPTRPSAAWFAKSSAQRRKWRRPTRSSQEQLAAARISPGEPRRIWRALEHLWVSPGGPPEDLHYDTFPGDAALQVFACKPLLPSPREPYVHQVAALMRKKHPGSRLASPRSEGFRLKVVPTRPPKHASQIRRSSVGFGVGQPAAARSSWQQQGEA